VNLSLESVHGQYIEVVRESMATSRGETFFRTANWEQARQESEGYEETDLVSTLTARAEVERPWAQVNGSAYVQARELELINALQMVVSLSKNPETLDVADVGGATDTWRQWPANACNFNSSSGRYLSQKLYLILTNGLKLSQNCSGWKTMGSFLIAYLTSLSSPAHFTTFQNPTRY